MPPRIGSTSLWKGYGIDYLPGLSSINSHLQDNHGGGNERAEGLSFYNVQGASAQPSYYVQNSYDVLQTPLYFTPNQGLRPVSRSYHPGMVSTQSSTSRHRLGQRYLGSGMLDLRSDLSNVHTYPTEYAINSGFPVRESASNCPACMEARRLSRFHNVNDYTVAGNRPTVFETQQPADPTTYTFVVPRLAFEISCIVGGLLFALLLVCALVK